MDPALKYFLTPKWELSSTSRMLQIIQSNDATLGGKFLVEKCVKCCSLAVLVCSKCRIPVRCAAHILSTLCAAIRSNCTFLQTIVLQRTLGCTRSIFCVKHRIFSGVTFFRTLCLTYFEHCARLLGRSTFFQTIGL